MTADILSPVVWSSRLLQLTDQYFRGLENRDDVTAHLKSEPLDRARGNHRGYDARGGLHVDFRQHRAGHDFRNGALELVAGVDGDNTHDMFLLRLQMITWRRSRQRFRRRRN